MMIFILVQPSQRVIALCLVSLYYVIKFDAPDRLRTATFII
jgi:hypothetical protein